MAALDVDGLYQLPLREFTAARNALARELGKAGGPVRALQKPSLPAWAVNQLYWHRRAVWEALVRAADERRDAHAATLAGKRADLDAAERAHQDAMKHALAAARALLRDAGESETSATLAQVTDTLQALPVPGPPGRLVRPLKPAGFEALAGLVGGGGWQAAAAATRPASAAASTASSSGTKDASATSAGAGGAARAEKRAAVVAARRAAEQARRQAQARAREAARLEKQVRAARAGERLAEAAFTRARTALARAERDRERLEDQIKFLGKQILDLVEDIRRRERELAKAAADRAQLEKRLAALRDRG